MLKVQAFFVTALFCLFSCSLFVGEAEAQQLSLVSQSGTGRVLSATSPAKEQGYNMREMGPETDRGYAVVQFGLYFGKRMQEHNENILVSPSLQLSGGYRFRHWLQLGLGTGLEKYGRIQVNPIFAELRGTAWEKFFSPYYVLKVGGALADLQNDFRYQQAKGGIMAEGQLGVALRFGHLSWLVGTGYRVQKVKLEGTFMGWAGENSRLQYREFRRLLAVTSFRFTF